MEKSDSMLTKYVPSAANMPNMFSSKMSGGERAEAPTHGFSGESVSPGKAIFMGGKRRRTRKNTTGKRRRHHNKQQSQRKKSRRYSLKLMRGGEVQRLTTPEEFDTAVNNKNYSSFQIGINGDYTVYTREQAKKPEIADLIKSRLNQDAEAVKNGNKSTVELYVI
jgi:hypothetical protein